MKQENRAAKFSKIEKSAYRLLKQKGYEATSMLSIAKASSTSNQTLYRWYGDKRGLFAEMVSANADEIRKTLEEAILKDTSPIECLEKLAPLLLSMLTGERAIALNRAAASDHSGELGKAIAMEGRNTVFPLLIRLMQKLVGANHAINHTPEELADLYVTLLVGDLQIRRVIGVLPPLSAEAIAHRANSSIATFAKISGLSDLGRPY